MSVAERFVTHEVANQVPPLGDTNLFEADRVLREAVEREGAGWAATDLAAFGAVAGGEMMACGFAANENRPTL